nr:hypothetical protein [Tanacetum cinerariifolium]
GVEKICVSGGDVVAKFGSQQQRGRREYQGKSRGKRSQGKKTVDTPVDEVEMSEESEIERAKMRTTSKRRAKKKVTISSEDNIIPNPDIALELGKSISQTKAKEADSAKKVHATHARIMTEPVPAPAKRRISGKLTSDPTKKLKGVPYLTPKEQEATNIMQALKESIKSSRRQHGTRGSSEGIGTILGVPYESTFISATSSEGTSTKPGVPYEENDITEEKDDKDDDADDEGDDHISDTQDANEEDVKTESDKDEIYKYKIHVRKDVYLEMENADAEESDKEKAILLGVDNRPPMLEKDMYDSWKSKMEIYMMNRQHGRMIFEFVENGPHIWPTIEENGVTRPKKYFEMSATEATHADCDDLHPTNIDQPHAYLGQHEFHANEVRLMHKCNSDSLALVATHQIDVP